MGLILVIIVRCGSKVKVYRWPGFGSSLDRGLMYFKKLLDQAKEIKATLLVLAKSIYYALKSRKNGFNFGYYSEVR